MAASYNINVPEAPHFRRSLPSSPNLPDVYQRDGYTDPYLQERKLPTRRNQSLRGVSSSRSSRRPQINSSTDDNNNTIIMEDSLLNGDDESCEYAEMKMVGGEIDDLEEAMRQSRLEYDRKVQHFSVEEKKVIENAISTVSAGEEKVDSSSSTSTPTSDSSPISASASDSSTPSTITTSDSRGSIGTLVRSNANDNDADDGTICHLCKEIMKSPLGSPCGHAFCQKCVLDNRSRLEKCPVCRSHIDVSMFYKLYGMAKLIDRVHKTGIHPYQYDPKQFPTSVSAESMRIRTKAKRAQNLNVIVENILGQIDRGSSAGKRSIMICACEKSHVADYFLEVRDVLKVLNYSSDVIHNNIGTGMTNLYVSWS